MIFAPFSSFSRRDRESTFLLQQPLAFKMMKQADRDAAAGLFSLSSVSCHMIKHSMLNYLSECHPYFDLTRQELEGEGG